MTALPTSAHEISDTLLQRALSALEHGDIEQFQRFYRLPLTIDTFEGHIAIQTPADVRQRFHDIRSYHKALNVTDVVLHCIEAEFRDENTIAATHTLRLLSGHFLVGQALSVFTMFIREGGQWYVGSSQYAFASDPGLNAALIGASRQGDAQDIRTTDPVP